jgi:hypothetical protein
LLEPQQSLQRRGGRRHVRSAHGAGRGDRCG